MKYLEPGEPDELDSELVESIDVTTAAERRTAAALVMDKNKEKLDRLFNRHDADKSMRLDVLEVSGPLPHV
eukprot:SAG11_NODE_23702_length_384_cov_0.905263_1_plen_71_part_00